MIKTFTTPMVAAIMIAGALTSGTLTAHARDAKGLKVYINPGHGGHESNDRNVVIAPYAQGDPNGYWESNSNLSKGLQLRDMLLAKGYAVEMSRVTNTEADDLNLTTIVRLSNESKADVFFSIHSNATGTVARRNFPLMLFRGYDYEPYKPQDKVLCGILNKYLLENQATYWTSTATNIRGDWSFYPSWGTSGLGVLRGNNVTAMLSEGSFHDYIPEAYRLMSDDFCWLEAWHFRKTVDEYFGVDGLATGCIAGRLNDTRVPREGDYIMYGDDKLATIQGAKVELVDAAGNVIDTYTTHTVHTNGFYLFKDVKPGTYTVRASVDTHMPAQGQVTVTADNASYLNLSLAKVRNTPPTVESYTPVWNDTDEPLLCNTPITVQFNWDMDTQATEKAFTITPAAEGTFTWEDLNYRLVFTPTVPYQTNTEYTVTIGTGAMHAGGTNMKQPVSFKFKTTDRNFMDILGHFPKDGDAVHYQDAAIEFRFDKYPNTTPILNQVTCTDSQGNAVAFNKRSMSNSKSGSAYGFFRIPFLKDLTVGETYTLNVSGEMADKDGITIQKPVTVKFTATDAGEAHAGMNTVEIMDNAQAFAYSQNGSSNVESASTAAYAKNLAGASSVQFKYAFNDTESGEALYARTAGDNDVNVLPGATMGVHLNGDLTGNYVYLEMTNETSTQYLPVGAMDFLGWKYFQVPATLEGAATLTGVKVVQNPSQMSRSGSFAIDHITGSSTGGVDDTVFDDLTVTVGPEYIVANGASFITSMTLVDMKGQTIARNGGNVINVSDILPGSYILLINNAAGQAVRKISL